VCRRRKRPCGEDDGLPVSGWIGRCNQPGGGGGRVDDLRAGQRAAAGGEIGVAAVLSGDDARPRGKGGGAEDSDTAGEPFYAEGRPAVLKVTNPPGVPPPEATVALKTTVCP